ncbi:MAG: hypothetical protein JWP58_3129 [Hymenobacter sp.]|nr:hypothetical protein [Hymenobacter sp.]
MGNVRQDNVQIKLEIDGSQSRTELDNLTRKAQVLQDGFKGLKKGSEEYVAQNKELSQVKARMEELRNEIGLTSLTSAQLKAMSSQLNRELSQLTPNTESFLNKAQELANVDARLAQVRLEAKGVKDELNNAGGGVMDFIKKAAGFAGIQLGVQAVITGLKQLGSESIDAAVKGSDSIADMEKALNLTTAEAKALRGQLEGIDTRTSEANLEGIAVAAGQLGIAKDEAVAFTQSVDQAVVALGDEFTGGVEDVTKSLGGLQKLFKETKDVSPADAIARIGSAVNALGADGSATGPVIADFTARIGQLGDLAPEITQTLGLGAAFQELGLSAEISSGGLTNVLLTASKDTAGFAKQIGLTDKEFQKLLNSDPNEVILRLAESLKGASNTEIISTLDTLGVKSQEAIKVVSLLANQTDFVRGKQALASAEYAKGTSLLDEFNKKNTNAAAEVAKAEKGFAQFRQELGERLIPAYLKFLQYSGLVLKALLALPGFIAENKTAFGLLAVAVLTFNAAQIAEQATTLRGVALRKLVTLGILVEEGGRYSLITATNLQTAATRALNAAMSANPIGIIITLLAAAAFVLSQAYEKSEKFREGIAGLGAAAVQVAKNIKEAFLLNLSGLADIVVGIFTFDGARVKKGVEELGASVKKTYTGLGDGVAGAYHQGYSEREKLENAKAAETKKVADKKKVEEAKAQAKKEADAVVAANEETLKARLANIKAALALVAAGSAEELRLKKKEVEIKRDIDLLDEKKTAGDKKVIRAEAARDLHQLDQEWADKKRAAAEKNAKEQAEVEKKIADLRASQIPDETERKIAQLNAAAEREKAVVKGTAAQIDEQKRLIEQKRVADEIELRRVGKVKAGLVEVEAEKLNNALIVDVFDRKDAELLTAHKEALLKIEATDVNAYAKRVAADKAYTDGIKANDEERVAHHKSVQDSIVAIEEDTAQRRRDNKRKEKNLTLAEEAKLDAEEKAKKLAKLAEEEQDDLAALKRKFDNGELSEEEYQKKKAAIEENYLGRRNEILQFFADLQEARDKTGVERAVAYATIALQALADINKQASDKELAKLDKDKKARLAKLDAEYKAGTVSKDLYEQQKSNIEANYDAKTRAVKKEAAEKEKTLNIAQSIIAGILAVIKAGGPFTPTGALTAIASIAATAKIIATPIPEFALGGVAGAPKPTWREKVRRFASGGINPVAGVPSVGQLHGGGGIRMVDGATGEHLGEWERGEPYMILSRDTYANNRELVDELLDTSLNRGGAPVRRRDGGHYADGGTPGGALPTTGGATSGVGGQELVQAVNRVEAAVLALPSRQHIAWGNDDTAHIEDELADRQDVRDRNAIR